MQFLDLFGGQQVNFVVNRQDWDLGCADLLKRFQNGQPLRLGAFMRGIHHMDQKIRLHNFFQSRAKSSNQVGGEFLDKAHRIGQEDGFAGGQFKLPGGWVERGEKLIRNVDTRLGQSVQQG